MSNEIPDPTTASATSPSARATTSAIAPHVLLGAVLLVIVVAIAVLAGLHDTIPVVLQALGIADAGALGVAVPAGSAS